MSNCSPHCSEDKQNISVLLVQILIFCFVLSVVLKEMTKVQARSQISSYLVRVKLNNGSELDSAGDTAAGLCTECRKVVEREVNSVSHCPSCLSCHQEQKRCCFPYSQLRVPIRDVKDICVTASSMEGASVPAYVALPKLGKSLKISDITVLFDCVKINKCNKCLGQSLFRVFADEYVILTSTELQFLLQKRDTCDFYFILHYLFVYLIIFWQFQLNSAGGGVSPSVSPLPTSLIIQNH